MSSVLSLFLRPPPAPPPEPPSPPTPPEPPDPPDPLICLLFEESLAQPPFSPFFRKLDSLLSRFSARSGDLWLMSIPLLPAKSLIIIGDLSLTTSTNPFTFSALKFPQVCLYSSPSIFSGMGRYWIYVEVMALVLWNEKLVLMGFITSVFTLVLSCSNIIALMRSLTALCRFCFDLALLEVVLWLLGLRSLFQYNQPVYQVHWSFHSSHLSFTEIIILLTTSLVYSGSVTRSIVWKTVLLDAEARTVVNDCSRSAFAGCLALTTRKAPCPPCGLELFKFPSAGITRNLSHLTCYAEGVWLAASCLCSLVWTFSSYDCSITVSFSAIRAFGTSALIAVALVLCKVLIMAAGKPDLASLSVLWDSQILASLIIAKDCTTKLKGILLDKAFLCISSAPISTVFGSFVCPYGCFSSSFLGV